MGKKKRSKAYYKGKLVDRVCTLILLIIIFVLIVYIGQEAVKEKLRYLRKVKELAGQSKDKADFIRQVKANFPTYEGDNYLEMSASALFK